VGVDYHLEPDLPYPAGHPRASENAEIQRRTVQQTSDLLRVAAAVRIEGVRSDVVSVGVLNLATGHHLPAGFAFAREMWLEVAVSDSRTGYDDRAWRVIVGGGHDGSPLRSGEPLNKQDPALLNFQAVLFDGRGETVLQNETTAVLTGLSAQQAGFRDRQQFLLPGETRRLDIALAGSRWNAGGAARRMRVRLLFRNFPPEFLRELGRRFRDQHGERENAERVERLVQSLRIHEIARDTIPLP
jgi:hypothetical protein